MTKKFCIAGPINPEYNYYIPHRLNRKDLQSFVDDRLYFVLHAPRQSGKTTEIIEFCHDLIKGGVYNALYINLETVQAVREDVEKGLFAILRILLQEISNQLPQENILVEFLKDRTSGAVPIDFNSLNETLQFLAQHSSKPLVLFDEIDSLIGDTLLSVLRQIRAGFPNRPKRFPHSLCFIGLRDVRDYRIWSREDSQHISASSPFNIKAESLVLTNFTLNEVKALYTQHTEDTGQIFSPEAIEYAYWLTAGQPWLINALAYQACYRDDNDPHQSITKEMINIAKEAIIKRRDTHLDSLIDKLHEPRVRPIIEAIITGETNPGTIQQDDLQYVRDLGLVRLDKLDIANPIYREIINDRIIHVWVAD